MNSKESLYYLVVTLKCQLCTLLTPNKGGLLFGSTSPKVSVLFDMNSEKGERNRLVVTLKLSVLFVI